MGDNLRRPNVNKDPPPQKNTVWKAIMYVNTRHEALFILHIFLSSCWLDANWERVVRDGGGLKWRLIEYLQLP